MTRLLFWHDKTVAEWVHEQAQSKFSSDPYSAFGFVDDTGRLRGGYVFTSFTGSTIEISAAGNAVVTRGAVAALLDYVFNQLKCTRLEMHTKRSNKRMTRILSRSGIKYDGIAHRMYGREHGVRFALTVDDLPAFKAKWKLP